MMTIREVHLLLRGSSSSAPLLEGSTQSQLLQEAPHLFPCTHCAYARTILLILCYREPEGQIPPASLLSQDILHFVYQAVVSVLTTCLKLYPVGTEGMPLVQLVSPGYNRMFRIETGDVIRNSLYTLLIGSS